MTVRNRETPELRAFRQRIEDWARGRLAATNPAYAETFKRRLAETGDDLVKVMEETACLLKEPTGYHVLLTRLLDVELWMDKCRQAVWYLGSTPVGGSVAFDQHGLWLDYHIDSWYFFAYGLLDRLQKLITCTCRHVIRLESARWKIVETELVADVEKMKDVIRGTRTSLTHGGGSVEALSEEGLWEPYLLVAETADPGEMHIFRADYGCRTGRQEEWHRGTARYTDQMFAVSGACFQKLSEKAFPAAGH